MNSSDSPARETLNPELLIFRDSRRQVGVGELVARLSSDLRQLSFPASPAQLLHVLLLAGELECALADIPTPASYATAAAAQLTSLLADAALACDSRNHLPDASLLAHHSRQILQSISYSGVVSVSAPEGFAYYALHPLDYADLVARLRLTNPQAFVVGIRSIGTTLSAVMRAKLQQLGIRADRITVRPTGHPYERTCEFAPAQRQAIASARAFDAQFIVCDEGPGRSGSSLLSVAEALEQQGVARNRILILCSHEPDVRALCAPDAERRWRRYRCAATEMTRRLPPNADEYAGGGEWRRHLLAPEESWPAVWPQMEPLRYLSSDGREMFTFEGHGPYSAAARARNRALSDSGFGAAYLGHEAGFGCHLLPPGRLLRRADLTPALLAHLAEYCAWRAQEFCPADVDCGELEIASRSNFVREFGVARDGLELAVERPTICDNRMAPHHWLAVGGRVLKLDAALHGDDHFFPGPCDIAWDLAGVIVEWELRGPARDCFLSAYQCASGDDPRSRAINYELAYAMFRLAWSRMAAASVTGNEEEARLMRDDQRYRRHLQCRTSDAADDWAAPQGAAIWKRSTDCAIRY